MKKWKNIFGTMVLLLMVSTGGCFNQNQKQKNESYKIEKETNCSWIVAKERLSGVEILLSGKVEEENITISNNLLKIIKYNQTNTVVSIAGDMKKDTRIIEILSSTDIISINTIQEIEEKSGVKRNGEVLLGDFNLSGEVDLTDFQEFAQAYGTYKSQHDIAPAGFGIGKWGDIYCSAIPDNVVELKDFIVFAKNYSKKVPIIVVDNSWPNETNTGIPLGTPPLKVITKNIQTTKAGEIFDAVELRGRLYIQHPNVVIKRSKLIGDKDYVVYCNTSATALTIEDCEITSGVIIQDGFIGRRNHLHALEGRTMDDGWSVTNASHVLLEDNLIDGLVGGPGSHLDGIQIMGGNDITVRHNWIEAISPPITNGGGVNAALFVDLAFAEITNVVIERNMFLEEKGYFSLRIDARGKVEVTGNRFRKGFLSGPYRLFSTVVTKWEDNAMEDGEVIPTPTPVRLVTSVTITTDKPNNTLVVGETLTAKAVAHFNDGSTVDGNMVWSSDNPKIATILPTKEILTAVSEGTVKIRALRGGKTGEITVTVIKKTTTP